jgi:hypothetical protein
MAAWAVGQTDRFRAALVGAGIVDWGMLAATGDNGQFEAALGGSTGWSGIGPHPHDAVSRSHSPTPPRPNSHCLVSEIMSDDHAVSWPATSRPRRSGRSRLEVSRQWDATWLDVPTIMSLFGAADLRLDMCDETGKAGILGEGCTF